MGGLSGKAKAEWARKGGILSCGPLEKDFLGVHMMLYHCFLLDGKTQAVDLDYLSPVIEMSVWIFIQIIPTEMLVQRKLGYKSGCYHILRLQSRKNQEKKIEWIKTQ